jgi:hypothetical protein
MSWRLRILVIGIIATMSIIDHITTMCFERGHDMAATRFVIHNEVVHPDHPADGWRLCFQWGTYQGPNGRSYQGFRFVWRRPDGTLQPARAQARLQSIADGEKLFQLARKAGWGSNVAEE